MSKDIEAIKSVVQTIVDCGWSVTLYTEDNKECGLEIENWTSEGVDMIHFLDFRGGKNIMSPFDIEDELKEILISFDVDDEIDAHREDKRYREAFTHRRSVYDFEAYEQSLREMVSSVSKVITDKVLPNFTEFDFEDLGCTMKEILE